MASETQSYENHAQWVPLWHYVATPILLINVIVVAVGLRHGITLDAIWSLLVAIALMATAWLSRIQAVKVQDRLIRLEMRLRLERVLPDALKGRIEEIGIRQLIALRFASDAELPGLVERCLSGQLVKGKEIKQAIRTWVPDTYRA